MKKIISILITLCIILTSVSTVNAIHENSNDISNDTQVINNVDESDNLDNKDFITEDDKQNTSSQNTGTEIKNNEKIEIKNDIINEEKVSKDAENANPEETQGLNSEEKIEPENQPIIEEPTTENISFNATKSDYLSYDPLYIAKYADSSLIDVSEMDMSRFINVVTAAKGVATYNVEKQSEFEFEEENYIAGMNYEMPVYNVDDNSEYYVTIPNVNLFNSNFKAYDLILAYNNDYAEIIDGWKYRKGILYIPKSSIDSPKNTHEVPEGATVAVQLNYAIGGDMDFSKSIPAQILTGEEPKDKTVHTSNIFDVDNLIVDTGVKGRKSEDISVFLNGHLIPINEDAWEYSKSTGELSIKALPAVVSNINIVFENRTMTEKAEDITVSFIENITPSAHAATSMEDMKYFRTASGKLVSLDIPSDKIFVGWRGYYDANWEHSARGGINDSQLKALKGFENSIGYLYGGYTSQSGAEATDEDLDVNLAPLWAINSYASGSDLGAQHNSGDLQGQLTKDEIVRHQVAKNPDRYEEHTIYEWLLKYRNYLKKSKEVSGSGNASYPKELRNGIGGYNNFAFQFPKSVKGATGSLVSSGEDEDKPNLGFKIESDEIDESYYIAASCNHLGNAASSNGNGHSRIYVTCIGLGPDYVVLAFVKPRDYQSASAIYKFRTNTTVQVKIKKSISNTNIPKNNSLYSTQNTTFALYAKKADAQNDDNRVAFFKIGANGQSDSVEVLRGKYYLVELKSGPGLLIPDSLKASSGGKLIDLTNEDITTINIS